MPCGGTHKSQGNGAELEVSVFELTAHVPSAQQCMPSNMLEASTARAAGAHPRRPLAQLECGVDRVRGAHSVHQDCCGGGAKQAALAVVSCGLGIWIRQYGAGASTTLPLQHQTHTLTCWHADEGSKDEDERAHEAADGWDEA